MFFKPPQKPVLATDVVHRFACMGPSCPDTCCAGWTIELDDATRKKYARKRDLKDAYAPIGEGEHAMRCEGKGRLCVMNREGWCGIQERYGEDFLSDTCYFFPRTYRRIGTQSLGGISLACPESARLTLFEPWKNTRSAYAQSRGIGTLIDRLPEGCTEQEALSTHQHIQNALDDEQLTAEQHLARLVMLCEKMEDAPHNQWPALARDMRALPPPTPSDSKQAMDDIQLLQGLLRVAITDGSQHRDRLYHTLREMEKSLGVALHWAEGTYELVASEGGHESLHSTWQKHGSAYAPLLHRWLHAYVANGVFPFAGLAKNPRDQVFLLAAYFAIMRLGLQCATHQKQALLAEDETLRVVQSIARLFDHITDVQIFFRAFDHAGWTHEHRLRALFGG